MTRKKTSTIKNAFLDFSAINSSECSLLVSDCASQLGQNYGWSKVIFADSVLCDSLLEPLPADSPPPHTEADKDLVRLPSQTKGEFRLNIHVYHEARL